MIEKTLTGTYRLLETKADTKVLILSPQAPDADSTATEDPQETQTFAWITAKEIGEILVTAKKDHDVQCVLSMGEFNLYDVDDDPDLVDLQHLELYVGADVWQGYLLPTGLPTKTDKRNRIIPTEEVITGIKA
ncbi:hypothetical protein GF360_01050 [candidate division WWE3 bacterium]|nr:hypothetical protein [candidate division WWE3 bacterium]